MIPRSNCLKWKLFIEQGVNAIVVKPVDTEAMDPMLEQAKDAKIPLIGVNALFKGVKKRLHPL
ncbi:hypothetical protein GCM10020331_100850 [Ectobacillus funiculus]